MKKEIQQKVNEILGNIMGISDIDVKVKNDEPLADMGINSIKFIQLVVDLEKVFEIEFDDDDLNLEKFKNINNIIEYIETKISSEK